MPRAGKVGEGAGGIQLEGGRNEGRLSEGRGAGLEGRGLEAYNWRGGGGGGRNEGRLSEGRGKGKREGGGLVDCVKGAGSIQLEGEE